MAYVKCSDCGKIYDVGLEACPQCGCPTEQQQLPPKVNSDDNTPIDIADILYIEEDKFEETKYTYISTREILHSSIDDVCQSIDARSPKVSLAYRVEKGVGQLLVCYDEYDFLKKIESIHDKDLADKYGWACRRMIINIDDRENIRLDLENNESIWNADFPISQEMFLKCCNAKKLEFKITKENGASVVVNGYYGFDPDSGAEIDVNGDVVPENDLILNFQALYNYVIDPNMFIDALRRRKMLDEWNKKQAGSIKQNNGEEVKGVEARKELEENQGIGWLIFGILFTVVGVIMSIAAVTGNDALILPGIFLTAFGIPMLIYGILRTKYNKTQAMEKFSEIAQRMN